MSDLEDFLAQVLSECESLRQHSLGELKEQPHLLHERLLETRAAQDRMEVHLVRLLQLKRDVEQTVADRKASLEDAWNGVAVEPRSFQFAETAPRERYAVYAGETMEETFELRRAEKAERSVRTALEIVRTYSRSLDNLRRDLDLRFRFLAWDTHLE